ncbi:head-tail adaptor [Fulvimarina manganoxydans]|uniref:Head-tail adaptor n=1 Tax=Fulvimarina manganoxydans TaxID=937218 RepID=A0A1W2ATL8_9HYPH|nr:head-tail adaptor protein [Fulvimarina manganoxydans]SMC64035.1 head-tail adaptor [Fulvimarina manganoxydans]
MSPLQLDPGRLSRHARLEEPVEVSDGMGGASTVWQTVRSLSIALEPVGASRRERFERHQAETRFRVICRAAGDILRGRRFSFATRNLLIETVRDLDETGRYLTCQCVEET